MIMIHESTVEYAINSVPTTFTPTQPIKPDFPTLDDGRTDESPHTCELYTKVGYQKKRKTMHYLMVLAAAVNFYHGDQQDDNGIFPSLLRIFPYQNSRDNCSGDCSTPAP